MQKSKKYIPILLVSMLMIIFILLTILIKKYSYLNLDLKFYNFLNQKISLDYLFIIKVITNFGGPFVLIFLTLSLFLVLRNKKEGICIALNLGVCTLLNLILKNLISRPRPSVRHLVYENGYSFPSGHAMASMAFYGFLVYLILKNVQNKYLKWIAIIFLNLLIIGIGFSRIFLGVHYFSDILAGFCLSLSYLTIYIILINKYILKFE